MIETEKLDFEKLGGILPAVIQDAGSGNVLMLGFMNKKALERTIANGKVVFWSRTKRRLWQKGETSGSYLAVKTIAADCDKDTLLIRVIPRGPACHTGTYSCFAVDDE